MKRILVTGASGFIGSHTTLAILEEGDFEVVVFDNFENGNKEALDVIQKYTNKKIKIYKGDLLNQNEISKVFQKEKIDAVVHFAALIEAGVSVRLPLKFYENNVSGSINLFKAMVANKVRKLVFSSTATVYLSNEEGLSETSKLEPANPYGQSKFTVEKILHSLASEESEEKIDSVILRYFNAAGAHSKTIIGQDYPRPTHLMTVSIEAALGIREKLVIFGDDYNTEDGTCIRDYIHVEDLADAHVKALNYLNDYNGMDIFNVSTGKGTSNLKVVKILEELHGDFNWEYGDKRAGDPAVLFAKPEKAKKVLSWSPKYSVKEMLEHAYNWKKKYPSGFKDLPV